MEVESCRVAEVNYSLTTEMGALRATMELLGEGSGKVKDATPYAPSNQYIPVRAEHCVHHALVKATQGPSAACLPLGWDINHHLLMPSLTPCALPTVGQCHACLGTSPSPATQTSPMGYPLLVSSTAFRAHRHTQNWKEVHQYLLLFSAHR